MSTRRQLEEALTTAAEAQDALRTTGPLLVSHTPRMACKGSNASLNAAVSPESKATDGHNRVAELEQEITSLQADIDRLRRELEQTRTQAVSLETAEEEAKALERHERDVELDEERNLAAAGVRRYDTGIPDGRSLRGRRGGDRFLPTEANISLEEVNAEAAGEMDGRGLDMEASGFNFTVSLEGGRGGGGAAEGGGPAGAAAALATTSLARAERALQWATSPQLTESAPTVAKAALRLVNWLQVRPGDPCELPASLSSFIRNATLNASVCVCCHWTVCACRFLRPAPLAWRIPVAALTLSAGKKPRSAACCMMKSTAFAVR